ncbi:MAG: hypothetical protein A3I24_03200 [Candidatus Harrisonbacteria bacterium RIFCSPLOWO2_02_FULL_41_13b]|uniref:Sugar ABC transporter substrate-binding protein n=1 Tax=Candidatus Harrisonbacteria bacterium RIFCSPLOWO2_02_FULL_41_13b TaxID=1798409 RepID=A0A1G1ZV26_9BACT|nr:MAG: hypothetical protein A3J53_01065 [Candidatus Harrisonbacteria bacterium RIFCSPHIGHO2_02_FULL_40_20]OGY67976.1 MAG: hypothetical protein A3I24_03200 [Candidatus Harrisonbacteria bacterium RIFCSPLOWO2_02_FULL_41_13b]
MTLSRRKITFIGVVLLVAIIVTGLFIIGKRREDPGATGTIKIWGVFDGIEIFRPLIGEFQKSNPGVNVEYTKINPDTYEQDLINGLATAQGPDLFMFHNSWLPKHFDKLLPLSESELPIVTFRKLFPSIVEQDFAPDGVIYALPLYIDTLAMFYNKDILDTKGIALPPKTWAEFQNLVPKLRELDRSGKVLTAGAAIGGSERSINRATDILNLLMLQSGAPMVKSDFTAAEFSQKGLQSLNFYTQFASPASPYYTWNDSLPYSIDHFIEGNAAIMFNYSHQIPIIKSKNPFLEFAVAPMLQPKEAQNTINWANYWGMAVSAKTPKSKAAWSFIQWLTTNEQPALQYLKATKRPPALRSLMDNFATNPDLSVFSAQTLTARSWPQIDNVVVEKSFSTMIENIIAGKMTANKAVLQSEQEITQLMLRRK